MKEKIIKLNENGHMGILLDLDIDSELKQQIDKIFIQDAQSLIPLYEKRGDNYVVLNVKSLKVLLNIITKYKSKYIKLYLKEKDYPMSIDVLSVDKKQGFSFIIAPVITDVYKDKTGY